MIVPWEALNDDTLQLLLEEYVSRDGTDYGEVEISLETRVKQVRQALSKKKLVVWFDEPSRSTNIIPIEKANAAQQFEQE